MGIGLTSLWGPWRSKASKDQFGKAAERAQAPGSHLERFIKAGRERAVPMQPVICTTILTFSGHAEAGPGNVPLAVSRWIVVTKRQLMAAWHR